MCRNVPYVTSVPYVTVKYLQIRKIVYKGKTDLALSYNMFYIHFM